MLSIFFGLMSALVWGAADFTGGLASRSAGPFRVLLRSELVGLLVLVAGVLAIGETGPDAISATQAAVAGALGTLGLLLLYQAMATGTMSIAAPVSALTAAILPVVAGSFTEGIPSGLTLMGFALALMAIWFVSQNQNGERKLLAHLIDLRLPLLAGVGFGSYFVLMHAAARENTLWPMLISRGAGLTLVALLMVVRRDPHRLPHGVWPIIILNGILDVGGNAFYILAGQTGRLDVSAVLSSLYPASTLILAAFILKERLSSTQWIGIGSAFVAIVLFAL